MPSKFKVLYVWISCSLTTIPEMLAYEVWLVFSNEGPGVEGRWNYFPETTWEEYRLDLSSAVSRAPKHSVLPLQNVLRSTESRDSRKSHLGRFSKPCSLSYSDQNEQKIKFNTNVQCKINVRKHKSYFIPHIEMTEFKGNFETLRSKSIYSKYFTSTGGLSSLLLLCPGPVWDCSPNKRFCSTDWNFSSMGSSGLGE